MNSMFSSDQDRNAPDRYLDTAYKALKGNPNATNQVLQAAAQGQAVGLKGLAAAAAQQSQQQAQQAMAQQQAQTAGQQPTIIQKLAQQGQGIMGQLPGSIQLASAPTADMAPQNMAGGGLVAFADGGAVGNDIDGSFGYEAADAYGDGSQGYAGGGLVSFAEGGALPPDVIDAIQSHFAYGGEVRGFAEGDYLRPHAYPWRPVGESADPLLESEYPEELVEVPDITYADVPTPGTMGKKGKKHPSYFATPDADEFNVSDILPSSGYWQRSGVDPSRAVVNELLNRAKGSETAKGLEAVFDRAAGAKDRWMGRLKDIEERHARHESDAASKEEDETQRIMDLPQEMARKISAGEPLNPTREGTYVPDPATVAPNQPEITPRSEVHKEGQKVSKEFETVKQPTPSVATTPGADTASLTSGESYGVLDSMGLGGLEQARDLVSQLRGQQRMDPEIAKRLEDMQSGARNSTIMQSIMGALGKGLTSRPGGRIALGEAALGALAGYQHGASSEDDMQRKAFDVYKQYADMPISEQQHAADFVLKAENDKAARQSAERIAEGKGDDALMRLLYSERGKNDRSQLMAGQKGGLTEGQKLSAIEHARKEAQESITKDFLGKEPPPGELDRRFTQYYISALKAMSAGEAYISGAGMGGGSQLGAGGLGGGSGGLTVTRSGVVR